MDAGVDGLVIEGTEGGGFKSPEEVGLIVLIQAIRKHTNLPIVAAGGIVDGVGMAAAFADPPPRPPPGGIFLSTLTFIDRLTVLRACTMRASFGEGVIGYAP